MNSGAALPVIAVLVLIGIGLGIVGLIVVAITLRAVIAVFLVLMGGYLLVRSEKLKAYGHTASIAIPIILILLGIAVYARWL